MQSGEQVGGPAMAASGQIPPAGWYQDPVASLDDGGWRFWDGQVWTERTSAVHPGTPPPIGQAPMSSPRGAPAPLGLVKTSAAATGDLIAPGVVVFGFFLSLVSLLLPWVTASTFFTGTASEGPPGIIGFLVAVLSFAGVAGAFLAFKGLGLAALGSSVAAAINGLLAFVYGGTAGEASQQTFGVVQIGSGVWILLLGSVVAGLAGLVTFAASQRD